MSGAGSVIEHFCDMPREVRVVTKKEIVKAISDEIGMTQLQTKAIVQKTFDAIVETLVQSRRIELRNFGVFEVKKRKARKARNPRTGAKVFVEEKFVVTFKPGKEMEERIRLLDEAEAQAALAAEAALSQPPHAAGSENGVAVPTNSTPAPQSELEPQQAEHHG